MKMLLVLLMRLFFRQLFRHSHRRRRRRLAPHLPPDPLPPFARPPCSGRTDCYCCWRIRFRFFFIPLSLVFVCSLLSFSLPIPYS